MIQNILTVAQICCIILFVRADSLLHGDPNIGAAANRNNPFENPIFFNRQQSNQGRNKRNDGPKSWDIRNLDMTHFQHDPNSKNKWISYFYEEAIIPTLQTPSRLMIDCVVIEVRQENDQRAALLDLGQYMELVPLEFEPMVTLTGLCGELKSPTFNNGRQIALKEESSNDSLFSLGSVILPGTLWCGLRDAANNYKDLGDNFRLDSCCRDHDHCPVKLSSFESRYGIMNMGVATRSHCLCDKIFFDCLKKVNDKAAESVGNVYFNLLRISCVSEDQSVSNIPTVGMLYNCTRRDSNGGCRIWAKRKNFQKKLKLTKFTGRF